MDSDTLSVVCTVISIVASGVIAWCVYVVQRRDAEMKEVISALDSQRIERSLELQEMNSLRTALLRNQQDMQTRMLEMQDWLGHHIKEQVEDLLMTERHPGFFASENMLDLTPPRPSVSSDIPRLGELRLDSRVIKAGQAVEVLFRVDDDGINFPVPHGALVRSGGQVIPVVRTSAKYMRCQVLIPADSGYEHELEFVMKDAANNENTQSVLIPVRG
ncbi:hypothetical protein SAMN05216598_1316 [Pseudomonas asplenii]|uniref:Uncharacterized protein n=1 Tax=Pseudomonas asplenii TaxID=53407 RepID=A0A1H1RHQ5_9PSED|nr:hypothetical protein [Pseudomonas asplenii]SDS35274.1 hypothetical protein SAMN05216598_1316 [Pseudomonas asplenii]